MRFSTILATATMVFLSVVSAQTKLDPATIAACNTCIVNTGIAAVPACKGLEDTHIPAGATLNDKQKACLCGLVSNKSWISACTGADKCPAEVLSQLEEVYKTMVGAPGTCDNLSASTSNGNRFCGASSVKVAAAGAAALAVAGALL
ncbi:hypothetical protein BKA57DRAFT_515543 [Linnemannia elongata]|nr:hypothetical protein BKA57DRAFT_515543 [Linnemannia elongata]